MGQMHHHPGSIDLPVISVRDSTIPSLKGSLSSRFVERKAVISHPGGATCSDLGAKPQAWAGSHLPNKLKVTDRKCVNCVNAREQFHRQSIMYIRLSRLPRMNRSQNSCFLCACALHSLFKPGKYRTRAWSNSKFSKYLQSSRSLNPHHGLSEVYSPQRSLQALLYALYLSSPPTWGDSPLEFPNYVSPRGLGKRDMSVFELKSTETFLWRAEGKLQSVFFPVPRDSIGALQTVQMPCSAI